MAAIRVAQARAPRARHHRVAGRVGRGGPPPRLPPPRRRGRSDGARRDVAVVGSPPRDRAGRGLHRAARVGDRRPRRRQHREADARRLPRVLHRLDAPPRTRDSFGERHGTGIQFIDGDVHREAAVAARRRRVPAPPARAGGPRGPHGARRDRGGPRGERRERPPAPHRAPAAARPGRRPRLAELDVIANVQPYWAAPDPMIETLTRPRVGERAAWLYPIGRPRSQRRPSGGAAATGRCRRPTPGRRSRSR